VSRANLDALLIFMADFRHGGFDQPADAREKTAMPTIEHIEPLLDVNSSAELLRVSPYTIRSWIRKGILRATKLGRLVRIEPCEVQRLIAEGRIR
jgi:excisionase family DNA binding protein